MYDENTLYWIWLAEKCGIASKSFGRLIARFDDPFEIYRLENEEIAGLDFIDDRLRDELCQKSLESSYTILRYCKQNKVDIISYGDARYPSRLKMLEDPPVLLYCLGTFPNFDKRVCVGVVGTRKTSAYGISMAYKIAYELSSANACIVSGMALGIDAVASCAALEAGGDTVAVLGCGIDIVYPRNHVKLEKCICASGAAITEYPPSTPPYGSNFPKRNRIISGLCQGVLVVEGNHSSGSMITAEKAMAQGREVFAMPGKIGESNSETPNKLIKIGANVALSAEDIILHYDFLYHDSIDYRGLKKGKLHSEYSPRYVERYGVSSEPYYSSGVKLQGAGKSVSSPKKTAEKAEAIKEKVLEATSKTEEKRDKPDNSAEILSSLDPMSARVFELMPIDRAISLDEFTSSGMNTAEVMTALTMLEINGLVSSLPGGNYVRK